MELVVLVNEADQQIGLMEKLEAHQKGLLHRAFSVFLFNKKGEMLLQKRANTKYHSPNLWTNAVCSHPRNGESYKNGALRRLNEELGISTEIEEKFHFIYKADVGQNLWEHELDYVFVGIYDGIFNLNPNEVSETRYISLVDLQKEILSNPDNFTEWFKIILNKYLEFLK
jgi:isopentenyl-diphosphate delta-isomerase